MPRVSIQTEDFDLSREVTAVRDQDLGVGAITSFVGTVRDRMGGAVADPAAAIRCLELEHYPGMTEAAIEAMIDQAFARFDIRAARVVHRVGPLGPGEQIVLVVVASAHRGHQTSLRTYKGVLQQPSWFSLHALHRHLRNQPRRDTQLHQVTHHQSQ